MCQMDLVAVDSEFQIFSGLRRKKKEKIPLNKKHSVLALRMWEPVIVKKLTSKLQLSN